MGSKSEPATFLGFLGDRVPPEDTTRACEISQLGGKPRWLTAEPPDTAPFKCRGCGADLDLVCQLSTPYSTNWRSLYLFGCHRTSACSLDAANWVALRGVVAPPSDAELPGKVENDVQRKIEIRKSSGPACGAAPAFAGCVSMFDPPSGTGEAVNASDDFFQSNDDWLDAAFSETSNWGQSCSGGTLVGGRRDQTSGVEQREVGDGFEKDKRESVFFNGEDRKSSEVALPVSGDDAHALLSQFCGGDRIANTNDLASVNTVNAPAGRTASAGKSGGDANHTQESCETGSSRPSSQSKDTPLLPAFFIEVDEEPMEESTAQKRLDERARELWSDYQRRDDDNSLAQEDEADRAFFGGGAFQNEEYEAAEDKVLQAFQRRLSRNPQQIIRYSFGGKPLWIRTDGIAAGSQEPSRCERCGARRVFEMQLMPTLIHTVKQKCPGIDSTLLKKGVSPNWGTVVIFTCSEDCVRDCPYQREFLVVQEGM
uniref:Programmed cell death protein 2, c-terminal domain-containing protein n=1 Tax=Toxoplasma gondii COUG TaxID=1074873 RepID=A0A2G8XPV7_TOXGO|nr:programmed cell death protein 2, c-terminal domain-containing protein [Toxoplasma gondii COUG]